jgi:hypothetical protein
MKQTDTRPELNFALVTPGPTYQRNCRIHFVLDGHQACGRQFANFPIEVSVWEPDCPVCLREFHRFAAKLAAYEEGQE